MDALGLREFKRLVSKHVEAFGTREDFKILLEIAAAQQQGNPPTLKQVLLDVAVPQSTLKRRLSRLVRRRFVIKRMTSNDRRVHCYSLPEKTLATLSRLIDDIRSFRWN